MISKLPTRAEGHPSLPVAREPQRQLGIRDLVVVVIRRRWIILGIALPIFLLALYATLSSTDSVTASARVMVETRQPEDPSFYNLSVDYDVLMSTASQVVISIPVAERAAAALADSLPVLRAELPSFAGVGSVRDLRDVILEHEDCNQVGETNILEISVIHPSGRFALMAVKAILDGYIEYNIETKKNQPAVNYYTDQIEEVKADLDSLFVARAGILAEYGIAAFKENAQANAAQIVEMERNYFTERANREALEARLAALRESIVLDPGFMPSIGTQENQDLLHLKLALDEERMELTKLRQEYNEDTEWVRRQQSVVEDLEQRFAVERANFLRAVEIDLETARSREASLAQSIAGRRAEVGDYPLVAQKLSSIDASIDSQRDLLEILQTKRGEVRLKSATDARISNILRLDEPSLSGLVGGAKKMIYLVLATLFGLTLGLLAAIFVENQDHRLYTRLQVEQHLEIPVLGTISHVEDK